MSREQETRNLFDGAPGLEAIKATALEQIAILLARVVDMLEEGEEREEKRKEEELNTPHYPAFTSVGVPVSSQNRAVRTQKDVDIDIDDGA